ncbi:CRISPR-associated endonuclease Cas1 [Fusobacterium sp. PH5-44]|uniref:CRISPR-associated endonuclease Cas1 n=1 Tax=unclassified Fusobacterium TaxID=2648384 RepID=UPI003D1F1D41
MDIYIQEFGSKLRKEQNHFIVISDGKPNPISPDIVDSIVIEGSCSLTTDSIKLAVQNDIPIYISDYYGNILGKFWKTKFDKASNIRENQLKLFSEGYGLNLARKWIIEKIESQKNHLRKVFSRRSIDFKMMEQEFDEIIASIEMIALENQNFSNVIMGYEGTASKKYYSCIKSLLDEKWGFKGRTNFKAKDPYNMILNYLFGILYSKIEHVLIVAGLDPKIGILHTNNVNKDPLTYDFIEKYRFIGWEVVFSMFSKKIINKNHFDEITNLITKEGRKLVLGEFYNKMNTKVVKNEKQYTYEKIMLMEAREVTKGLIE